MLEQHIQLLKIQISETEVSTDTLPILQNRLIKTNLLCFYLIHHINFFPLSVFFFLRTLIFVLQK